MHPDLLVTAANTLRRAGQIELGHVVDMAFVTLRNLTSALSLEMEMHKVTTEELQKDREELKELRQWRAEAEPRLLSVGLQLGRAHLQQDKLREALGDALSTFRHDDKTTMVTADRQEMWQKIYDESARGGI